MTSNSEYNESVGVESIKDYLKSKKQPLSKVTFEPNGYKTSPDYILDFDTSHINLEVTISGNGFILTPDSPKTPSAIEDYQIRLNNMLISLETLIKKWIKPNETIILSFLNPVTLKNRGSLAKKTSNHLKRIYQNNELTLNKKIKFQIETSDTKFPSFYLEAKLTNSYEGLKNYAPLMPILDPTSKCPNQIAHTSLSLQAQYILQKAINGKTKKLIDIQGIKWLAIVNTHPLLNPILYQKAF